MLSSLLELVLLLLFVAPGFLYTTTRRRLRRAYSYYREPTQLEEIVTSVIWSFLIQAFLGSLALSAPLLSKLLPPVHDRIPLSYSVYIAVVTYIGASFVIAHYSGRYWMGRAPKALFQEVFLLSEAELNRDQQERPDVLLHLSDNTKWTGELGELRGMGDEANTYEMLLFRAVRVSPTGESDPFPYEFVLIRSDNVESIARLLPPPAEVQ